MNQKKIVISGTGCALADFLYTGVRFDSPRFRKYLSKQPGDGGLSPGKLVFTEELEKYSGVNYPVILNEISGNSVPDTFNVGGPGLVSFIHASQMLDNWNYEIRFFGSLGTDETADKILTLVRKTPLNITGYQKRSNKPTSFTDVLSDPTFADGHGERTFVNNIGAAWDFSADILTDDFFDSQIVCFGGTALVPHIHDNLTDLLKRSKQKNCLTVVNTVFDFRNERKNPDKPWPLVSDHDSFNLIDVLIMDREEALRISGQSDVADAARFFIQNRVSSVFITNGAGDILTFSDGRLFHKMDLNLFPVSGLVTPELRSKGDTTGCGDNFAGGIISSLASRLNTTRGNIDLISCLSSAVASGGFACSYIGGTFFESYTGEKRKKIEEFRIEYLKQIGDR
ncbi:MAG: carbohydrate kinase family protein [Bacteroidota bacterium]